MTFQEMEDAHFTPQDDMDDEEGLEVDEDVDMEYGEETASEDTSPSEMEDEEIMVAPALDAGDWEDQDDEDGDDDDDVDPAGDPAGGQHDEDEDDAEDDEDQDDDDGGDEEGGDLWQVSVVQITFARVTNGCTGGRSSYCRWRS
jgi:E3 ubiquitin-protein ligase HUWE1